MSISPPSQKQANNSRCAARSDGGFSLIEILVTITIMGIVATSLSLIITTVLTVSPGVESRNDDSRSLLGLVTYMPEDVNSTPAGNFDFDPSRDSGCSDPGDGVNLVHMTWSEDDGTLTEYMASYRFVDNGSGYRIYRFACESGGTSTRVRPMSSNLPDIDESTWTQGDSPVYIDETVDGDGVVNGLTLSIDTVSGSSVDFEMRTNNPAETLSPLTPTTPTTVVPGNGEPSAGPVSVITTKADPVTFNLPVSDPDGDGLVVTLGDLPTGWTQNLSGLTLTLDPKSSNESPFTATIPYSAADPDGSTASSTITVEIVADSAANTAPTASPVITTGSTGAATLVNLPVEDVDADPLTVTWSGADPSLDISVTDTVMSITPDGSVSSPAPFTYTVTDPSGASASSSIEIVVTTCVVTGLTPASPSVALRKNGRLEESVDFEVTYTGPCTDLILEYDNNLADGYDPIFESFGSGTGVSLQGQKKGLTWSPGDHVMTLKDGQFGSAILTSTLKVTG